MATRFGGGYRERDEYSRHLSRLERVNTKLDTSDPRDNEVLRRQKRKRRKYGDYTQYKIDEQNEALLSKLIRIRDSGGQLDNWNSSYKPKLNKNREFRRRQNEKIDVENRKLLKRLQNSRSNYNRSEWENSFVKHQRYLRILGARQKPWHVRNYREKGSISPLNSPNKRRKLSREEKEEHENDTDTDNHDESGDSYEDDYSDEEMAESDRLPEIKSAASRNAESRRGTPREENLNLPPIHQNSWTSSPRKKEKELDDYERLEKAIKEDDNGTIFDVLAKNAGDKEKLNDIIDEYNEDHEKNVDEEVKERFGGEKKELLLAILKSKPNYDATCIHDELKGDGLDQDTVVEILASRDGPEIMEIKKAYEKEYSATLEDDIRSSTSGPYQDLLLRLCQADRDINATPMKKLLTNDTKSLLQYSKARTWGTDDDEFIEILSKRSHAQLKALLADYKKFTKVELESTLEKQTSGDFLDASNVLLQLIRNRPKYLAKRLNEGLKDDPVNYEAMAKILNSCNEDEIKAIKAAYKKSFNTSVKDDINKTCDEDLQKLLVPLIEGDDAPIDDGKKKNKRRKPGKSQEDENDKQKNEEGKNKDEKENDPDEENEDKQSKYHGTITPAANFDVAKDVEFVRGALVYKDRDGVIKRLTSRSSQQRQAIAKKFSMRYKQDLLKLLKIEFGPTMLDAFDSLMLPPAVQDARTLNAAMKNVGTKEKDLIDLICFRNSKDIIAIKEAYQEEFERDLENDVRNESSGDFEDILSLLLQAKRSNSSKVKPSDVERDVDVLVEACEGQLGTDEHAIVDILTSRSTTHLEAVFEQYKKSTSRDFLNSMMSELSGDLLKAVIAIVAFAVDPTKYFAEIIDGIIDDEKTLTRFIASRSEIDMVEVKQAYKTSYHNELESDIQKKHKGNRRKVLLGLLTDEESPTVGSKQKKKKKGASKSTPAYHPTVVRARYFNSSRDAEFVYNSLADTMALVDIIVSRSNKQRCEIRQKYASMYDKDILDDLMNVFDSESENILKPLFVLSDEYEATLLHQSIETFGDDEDFLISSICLKNNQEIANFKEAFKNVADQTLAEVVENKTGGDLYILLNKLLEGNREESNNLNEKLIEQDAKALRQADKEEQYGTEESKFIELFSSRSYTWLAATFEKYKKMYKSEISEALNSDKIDDSYRKALVLISNLVMTSSPNYYANVLHSSIDDVKRFPYLISTRAEIDMVEIKDAYEQEFTDSLLDDIALRYSDVQRLLLHSLIKEGKSQTDNTQITKAEENSLLYHPTVAAAANFNADKDVESIYNTQSSAFDMDEVIIILVRRTVKQRKEIVRKYSEKYEKDLVSLLCEELQMDPVLLNALFEDTPGILVQNIKEAIEKSSTDGKQLLQIISTKTNKEIEEIKKSYKEAFNEDICDVVSRDVKSDLASILLKLLKLERIEGAEIYVEDVNEDAKFLHKVCDQKWRSDKNEFLDIFATRTRAHLQEVFKEFKKIARKEITDSLKDSDLKSDLRDALLLLVELTYRTELSIISAEIKSNMADKQKFTQLVVAHSEVDMVEVKEEYKKEYNITLADDIKKNYEENHQKILLGLIKEWKPFAKAMASGNNNEGDETHRAFHPTVTQAANFDAENDADTLFKAKEKSENIPILLLASRTTEQRIFIREEYETKYKTNLLNDLSEQLKIKPSVLAPLFVLHDDWVIQGIQEATKGFGTDEKVLIDAICDKDNKGLQGLQSSFRKEYGKDLSEIVATETTGQLKKFLLGVLKAERRENQPTSVKQVSSDANALGEAGKRDWRLEETRFVTILTTRSRSHLKQVLVEYKKLMKKDLVDSLKDEYNGDLKYALISMATTIHADSVTAGAMYLNDTLGNACSFMGCLSHRAEIDTVEIKEQYNKTFSTSLANDINQKFNGNTASLMLALLKEWNPEPQQTAETSTKKGGDKEQTDVILHPTVVPAKPFKPAKDIEAVRKAIGKDKIALINVICCRPLQQRKTLVAKYKERYNKANMLKAIKDFFGPEFEEMLTLMFSDPLTQEMKALKQALKGPVINEKAVYQILCRRTEKQLQVIKEEYKKATGHSLLGKINETFSGDLRTILVEILKCDRSDVQTADHKMAEVDAKGIFEIKDEVPSEKIIETFTRRSIPQIKAFFEEFIKISNTDELRPDLLDTEGASQALVMLASFLNDPQCSTAKEIKRALTQDLDYGKKLITTHSEIDMVEVKFCYEELTSSGLEEDIMEKYDDVMQSFLLTLIKEPDDKSGKDDKEYHPTVTAAKGFKPQSDADDLKNFKGSDHGTDKIIALICGRTKSQRIKINDVFFKKHNSELVDYLCMTLKVKEKNMSALFFDDCTSKAKALHQAMKGFGTDEKSLINILCYESNQRLKAIKEIYLQDYGKDLAEAIDGETSGDFGKMLQRILQADRRENQVSINSKVKNDAKILYEAGVKKTGTDEQQFIDILVSRSRSHLQHVFAEYKKVANEEIEESIKKEFSGDSQDCLLALVSSMRFVPEVHWSTHLNKNMSNTQELFDCISQRSEIDMVEVKEEYQKLYTVSLADDIRKHQTENAAKILLALIKEFNFPPKPPAKKLAQRGGKTRANKARTTAAAAPVIQSNESSGKTVFHGTVVPAKVFDAAKDVTKLEISFVKDKNAVIKLLTSRSATQRQGIMKKYKISKKKDLVGLLNEHFPVEPQEFFSWFFLPPMSNNLKMLNEALKVDSGGENALIDILCQKTDEEIEVLKYQYQQEYKVGLSDEISRKTKGKFGKLMQEIAKCDRDDRNEIDEKKVNDDAKGLYQAATEKSENYEEKVIETLTARSYKHLNEMFREYEKVSGKRLDESINESIRGDVSKALLTIISHVQDPFLHTVKKLKETVEKDSITLAKMILEHSEVDMVELKDVYQQMWSTNLSDDINMHCEENLKSFLLALIKEWDPSSEAVTESVEVSVVEYHATVVPAQNFDADKDAMSIKEKLGQDKNFVVDILATRTKVQRQSICSAYKKQENEELVDKLMIEFDEDCADTMPVLFTNGKSDVEKLHDAMQGFGTKEDVLIDILCRRDVEEIKEIKTLYKKSYSKELQFMVNKETSGNFKALLMQIIECTRVESSSVDMKQVDKDADELFKAGEGKTGTDESKFIDVFTNRSFLHLNVLFDKYHKISKKTMEETLAKEFSGDIEKALTTIVSYAKDPLTNCVVKLNDTIKENPKMFTELVVEHAEFDMVEIKELYRKTYDISLADDIRKHYNKDQKNILLALIDEWSAEERKPDPTVPVAASPVYNATVIEAPDFVVQNDIKNIKNLIGKNSDEIVAIMTSRTKKQRLEVAELYQKQENKKIEDDLVQEFGVKTKDILAQLLQNEISEAEQLHNAMKGFGTKEDVLINILCRRTKQELREVKVQYKKNYKSDLDMAVSKETSGDLQVLLSELLKCDREEKEVIYVNDVREDAIKLHQAGEKKIGTDEITFIQVFTSRSFAHLKMLFEEYLVVTGKTIRDCIRAEFTGDIESALLTIVSYVENPLTDYVEKLRKTIKDDPNAFMKLVIDRSEIDMVQIKELYKATYQITLADDIKQHYDDETRNFLLGFIKEWVPEEQRTIAVEQPSVYHATVLGVQEFSAEKDVKELKNSLGTDNNSGITLLTTRSREQRLKIGDLYQQQENHNLQEKLKSEFGKESEHVLSAMFRPEKADAMKLNEAMKGFGTKEDVLISILCRRTTKEIVEVKEQFKNDFEKDLADEVRSETSGDLQAILLEILKCEREKNDVVFPKQLERDATDLYEAGEKKTGTDESKFIHIFTSRSHGHLKLLLDQYNKSYGKTLDVALSKEFSGDTELALKTIVSYVENPLTYNVSQLKANIKDDPEKFCDLVVDHSEVDMVELKELYQKTYHITLADDIKQCYKDDAENFLLALIKEWTPEKQLPISVEPPIVYHATVVAGNEFLPEKDATSLKDNLGKDRNNIISLFSTRTGQQRTEIAKLYEQNHKSKLHDAIKSEFGNKSEEILFSLLHPKKSDAEKLYDAMKGFGTKEDVLIEILCRRTTQEIAVIKTQYKSLYEKTLEEAIKGETSGDLRDLLTEILKGERKDDDVIYENQLKRDATDLYEAGEKKTGTDESLFIHIFTQRSFDHLKLLFKEYQKNYGKTMLEALAKEFSGDTETAFRAIVSFVEDPLNLYVHKLKSFIKDDRKKFCDLVVERSEVDMVEIKELYQRTYQISLADDIKQNYQDETKELLLALIKEWSPEIEPPIPVTPPAVYHATVLAEKDFSPERDVAMLKNNFGKNRNNTISLLTTRTKQQRLEILDLYKKTENSDPNDNIKAEFGKESEKVVSSLLEPNTSDAEKLFVAMKGFGTNESVLINILCRCTTKEITEIKAQYESKYEKSLDEEIKSETSGDFQNLLIEILKCEREEKDVIFPDQLKQDAKDLYEAGEKKLGTDESRFIYIFTKRSLAHLKLLFENYEKTYGKSVNDVLNKEFSGDMKTALETIVSHVQDPLQTHVSKLKECIKDDPKMFSDLVVERSEIDMVEIKDMYQKRHEISLADDIKHHYNGHTRSILLALIKEWTPEKEPSVSKPAPLSYHATVRGFPSFNIDDDVRTLKESIGKDKNPIITILTTRNRTQRQAIGEKYEILYGEDLCQRLQAELGDAFSGILLLLMHPMSLSDSEVLYNAMKGFGSKKDILISVICRRSTEELKDIKNQFQNKYGKDLLNMVDDETSGDLNKLLVELLKCQRNNADVFDGRQVETDAADLYKAGEKSWGTDEATFIDIFTKRSFLHLRAVFNEYKKVSGNDIVTALNKELGGQLLDAFLALVSSARDPPTYYAGLAKQTVKDSPHAFERLVIERCEIDTVEIKEVYHSVYKKKLADEILANYNGVQQRILLGLLEEPWEKLPVEVENHQEDVKKPVMKAVEKPVYYRTIKDAPPFNPKDYAAKLKKAMKGFGCDEKTILQIVSSVSNQQRMVIADEYKKEYGKDLVDEFKSELSGDFENLVVALMLPPDTFYSYMLHKAMKGLGTDEETIVEVICCQTSQGFETVAKTYEREYSKRLEDAIKSEATDEEYVLFQGLMLSMQLHSDEVDMNEVESSTTKIMKGGEKRWKEVFPSILRTNSFGFMFEVFKAFHKAANCDIIDVIKKENSGSYEEMLVATVSCIRDRPSYIARRLHNALDKLNVDEDALIRCVVGRSEIDLASVKKAFQTVYNVSLYEKIEKKCRGDFQKLLLAIVNGN